MNLQPIEKGEALEKGDLMHKMLEVYYSLNMDVANLGTEVWTKLEQAGIKPGKPLETAVEAAYFFSMLMDLPVELVEETVHQFREYCEYYKYDKWRPRAVEETGIKTLYEDDNLLVKYSFKIDLVAEHGNLIAPFDHKTGSRSKDPTSVSNQFIGYCWGINSNTLVVNKIGFQKTLPPQQRFQRYVKTIDNDRIKEWLRNSEYWVKKLARHVFPENEEDENWEMNLTSCDKYSGCPFLDVCESNPAIREFKLERNFKPSEHKWDVSENLLEYLQPQEKDDA
jgi:hypothetical protein